MIAHAIQGIEHRVFAHERGGIMLVRENILPVAGVLFQFAKHGDGLPRQRHDMQFLHLHAFGRNSPLGFVPINLRPLCPPQFVRADESKQQKAERQPGLQAAVIGLQLLQVLGQVSGFQEGMMLDDRGLSARRADQEPDFVRPARWRWHT